MGEMDKAHDGVDEVGEDSGWSLLYAPATSLQPIACAECGNVFAAESAECPWCGRPVGSLVAGTRDELELGSSAALLVPTSPALGAGDATADGDAGDDAADLAAVGAPQARRWAGVIVAAGVLLAIATGVFVRSGDDDGGTAAPVTTAASATTAARTATTPAAPATTVAPTTAATTAPSTAPSLPDTTAPSTAAPATTTATTAPATTAPARTTVAPTTTVAGPSLSAVERDALQVTRDLNDAIVAENWNRVRLLAPKNAPSDDVYETYWGGVEAATVVPARVAAKPGGLYDVYVGVVSVVRAGGELSSSVVCGRYTVDPAARVVDSVVTKPLRTVPGTADAAALTDELRTSCSNPTF